MKRWKYVCVWQRGAMRYRGPHRFQDGDGAREQEGEAANGDTKGGAVCSNQEVDRHLVVSAHHY